MMAQESARLLALEDDTMARISLAIVVVVGVLADTASADTFGTGGTQFAIDFVPISGATNPVSGYGIVNNDYRMGRFEITNDQWNKFKAAYGPVTGNPSSAYSDDSYFTGTNVPANNVSWYEAAQFVNWLNTSTGHQAAYKFTGTQGTIDYALATWSTAEADNGTNLYRHKDAMYYLPTEHEWVKAAYWNGMGLQTYATKAGDPLFRGNGTNGGWNYYDFNFPQDPWAVGSGSEELNGTFDMMGNVCEWTESPWTSGDYGTGSNRVLRGGSYLDPSLLVSSGRSNDARTAPYYVYHDIGFRVASETPEPATLLLLSLAGLATMRRR
jgi:formylglycine-generating enzyme required for sulfatase activity